MINITLGALAIICDGESRVLLVKTTYRGERWQLPGGFVEEGESAVQALLRELKEELKIDAVVGRLAGVYYKIYERNINLVFWCETPSRDIIPDHDEIAEAGYFAVTNLPSNLSSRGHQIIWDCLTNPNKTFVWSFSSPDTLSSDELPGFPT